MPIDNKYIENQMRPWALGRRNWLFIGSQLAGERAAVVMSLLQSALCRARHNAESLLTGGRGAPMLPLAMALPAPGSQKIPLC